MHLRNRVVKAATFEGRTHREQIVVSERTLPGLARMADTIHESGARIAGQVGHAGPVANGRSNRIHAVSASSIAQPVVGADRAADGGSGLPQGVSIRGGVLLEKALRFREALTMPLILLGGISTRATMERVVPFPFPRTCSRLLA